MSQQPTLESLFLAMVQSHNERALELRIMYRLLNESGCSMPLNFMAPDATYEEMEEVQSDPSRPFFGLQRAEEALDQVAQRQDGPIRGSTTEVHASGIVITTHALTDDGNVVIGDRRKHERPEDKRDNGDVIDVEVHTHESTLSQLRRAAEEGAEPEPTIPADFSLASATKVEVMPITKADLLVQELYDILLQYVSPALHAEGKGTWITGNIYDENPQMAPNNLVMNWQTGLYRNDQDNRILINAGSAVFVFSQSYRSDYAPTKKHIKVLLLMADQTIVYLHRLSSADEVDTWSTTAKGVLEAFFTNKAMQDETA